MPQTDVNSGIDGLVRNSSATSFADAVSGAGDFSGTNNQVANVNTGTTFFCGRCYYRFDTTGIATDQVATEARITVRLSAIRGGTTDDTEIHKFFNSTDHSSTFGSALFDTVGDAVTDAVDVGSTIGAQLTFILNSTGLSYINTQIAAGNQCAFLQRCQNDYQNPGSTPSGVNTRTFNTFDDGTTSFRPVLAITHGETSITTTTYNNIGDEQIMISGTMILNNGLVKI